ncbi:uncharacterized protein LOC131222991 isoform X3 [Magnolia sinica]|nr:uncharacterized protein LOC131222991 isoform X3 [Magnolia sinica]
MKHVVIGTVVSLAHHVDALYIRKQPLFCCMRPIAKCKTVRSTVHIEQLLKIQQWDGWGFHQSLGFMGPPDQQSTCAGRDLALGKITDLSRSGRFLLFTQLFLSRLQSGEMSAGGAFGGNRGLRPVPPEKG